MEILQGAAATLRFPEADGDPVSFEMDPVVTVTRHSDGSAIATAAATTVADDYFTYDIAGTDLAEADLLVAVWTDGNSSYTTYAEVVGGFVTPLKPIKDKLGEETSDDDLAGAREAATTQIESACGVAFRPRYGKDVLDGNGLRELLLSQPRLLRVLSATVGGEAIDLEELTLDPAGALVLASRWTRGRANVEIAYVHGYSNFGPAALPVIHLAAYLLTPSPTDWSARATSYSNADGSYSLVTPGMRGATFPLPTVNAFVNEHRFISVG